MGAAWVRVDCVQSLAATKAVHGGKKEKKRKKNELDKALQDFNGSK